MPDIQAETEPKPQRLSLPALDERCVRALASEHLTNPRQRQVYLLYHYGDERRPDYSTYAIAKKIGVPQRTVHREVERAEDIMEPVLLAEIERRRNLCQLQAPTQIGPPPARYEVTLERGDESETVTLETEMCALTGMKPGKSNWKTRGA